ncbi:protein JINGUBANG-like [Lolium rigidum]|uniref:protein JINGUBANG-like n=1 Tax=Lolium rigidum TaxID=89674 RepID=UPI001F5DDC0F|nr:protein JINGUBANG-like [Lolium rigidum]
MRNHKKLLQFLRPDPAVAAVKMPSDDDEDDDRCTPLPSPMSSGSASTSAAASPSPYMPSPWVNLPGLGAGSALAGTGATGLLGSLVKADGHVYSMAAAGDLLYTGTDSKNVRVWKDQREFAGFKCGSGLVKAIVVAGDGRIYTGHQDGKVRVWRRDSADDTAVHKRVGSLPRLGELLRSSVRPSHYVQTGRRKQSALWLRHFDAVSCLSLDVEAGVIYSGSWDRTFKVWRVADSRCLESVRAHDDAVNTVSAAGFDALAFTGSADGTVKVWRREAGKHGATRHVMERVLRKADSAVTAVAVASEARVVYVASSDGAVTHWQWRRGAARESAPRNGGALRGHRMAVLSLAVAGRVVVSGSADRTVCVWRRDEGADHSRLAVLTGHTGPVKCVAMDEEESLDADGHRRWVVYSGSLDGSVKVWRVSDAPDAMAAMARTPAHVWKGSPSPLGAWSTPRRALERS